MQKILVIAAIQRKIVDLLVGQRATQGCRSGVDQRHLFGDGHHFVNLSRLEREIGAHVGRNFNLHSGALRGFEASGLSMNLVGPGLKIGHGVVARLIRRDSASRASLYVCDGDDTGSDGGATLVGKRAENAACSRLGVSGHGKHSEREGCEQEPGCSRPSIVGRTKRAG